MLKKLNLISFFVIVTSLFSGEAMAVACGGRFPNPVTDVCWLCMFPFRIGPTPINAPGQVDPPLDVPPPLLCACPFPPPVFVRFGVGISYWEPARVAEVVRTPFCSPFLGGTVLGPPISTSGDNSHDDSTSGKAFYQVHWFTYPLLSWLGSAITSTACYVSETFDLAYLTELDPLWNDDEISFLINPEAILFTSVPAQAACVADTVAAATTSFGLDKLFWCSGSAGSIYPFTGNKASHVGGIDSSLSLVHRHVARMHRSFLSADTSTPVAMCFPTGFPQPLLRKNQYKQQMLFPIPNPAFGLGFGAPSTFWGAGHEFPYQGEDFSYLVWRKRTCCAL